MSAPTLAAPVAAESSDEVSQFRAFVRDDETRKVIEQVIGDLMIPHAAVLQGGIDRAVETLGRNRSPRLLLVDLSGVELPLSAINELADVCEPGVTVIALGDRNDVGLFRDLISRGVFDYLVKPITPALLQRSLLTAAEGGNAPRQTNRLGRLIAVVGARGGVGATMIAANTAWAIANVRHRRVAAVDLDLQLGSLGLALDLEPSHGLREAIESSGKVDSLYLERAMVKQSETLHVLSAEEPLDDTLLTDSVALDLLVKELRTRFHYVVVDVPRSISAAWQYILQSASNLVIVTDLSLAGMRDSLRIMSLMPSCNASCQLALVANRVGEHKVGALTRAEFEKGIGRPLDVMLPFDQRVVAAALNSGQAVAAGRSAVAKGIGHLTDLLCGSSNAQRHRKLKLPSWLGGKV
jgi:pilus assembly protein CpaE